MPESEGYLMVRTSTAQQALPVSGANVSVFTADAPDTPYRTSTTDSSGQTELFTLPAPPVANSESPDGAAAFQSYSVLVEHPNYRPIRFQGVSVFPGITSTLPVYLVPTLPGTTQPPIVVTIETQPSGAGGEHA